MEGVMGRGAKGDRQHAVKWQIFGAFSTRSPKWQSEEVRGREGERKIERGRGEVLSQVAGLAVHCTFKRKFSLVLDIHWYCRQCKWVGREERVGEWREGGGKGGWLALDMQANVLTPLGHLYVSQLLMSKQMKWLPPQQAAGSRKAACSRRWQVSPPATWATNVCLSPRPCHCPSSVLPCRCVSIKVLWQFLHRLFLASFAPFFCFLLLVFSFFCTFQSQVVCVCVCVAATEIEAKKAAGVKHKNKNKKNRKNPQKKKPKKKTAKFL